jgi:uncharacterized protein
MVIAAAIIPPMAARNTIRPDTSRHPRSGFRRLPASLQPVRVRPLPDDIVVERDVPLVVRDGATLYANVFRPPGAGAYPVILSCSPYGKDDVRGRRHGYYQFRPGILLFGLEFGDIEVSEGTAFEAPDPARWVPKGYAVVHYDTRGSHRSQGSMDLLAPQDHQDLFDAIEWAGTQPWSSGKVALCGVSYLAIAQWFVAAARPPHLRAIVPWEGFSDAYRDCAHQGGIPQTGFIPFYVGTLMFLLRNKRYPLARNFLRLASRDACMDDFWRERIARIEDIDVPALICGSWSDQGLHTRGAFDAFERIGSRDKFLYTHGRKKWETFYSEDAFQTQLRFLDHYLKEPAATAAPLPGARIEVRIRDEQHVACVSADFPVPGTNYRKLYLDGSTGQLCERAPASASAASYWARRGRARFAYRFDSDTYLVGYMALRLYIACTRGRDMDVFVGIRKLDADGNEVRFPGFSGNSRDIVAKGWLRASHRELDAQRSRPWRPYHTHRSAQPVIPGQVVALDIEILPSGTLFERGAQLLLDVQGRDLVFHPLENHLSTRNRGRHRIYCGGDRASFLLIPDATEALAPELEAQRPPRDQR